MTPNTIEFRAHENTWVMQITADKRILVNEGVEVTEAAQKVLDAMQTLLDRTYGRQEPTACLIDGKLMAYGNKPLPQEGLLYMHMQGAWVDLTEQELVDLRERVQQYTPMDSIKYGEAIQRATAQALKEKNHD